MSMVDKEVIAAVARWDGGTYRGAEDFILDFKLHDILNSTSKVTDLSKRAGLLTLLRSIYCSSGSEVRAMSGVRRMPCSKRNSH